MKEVILIPSYEPDNKLIELIKTIDLQRFFVIVVDDGSGKKYQSIFESLDKRVHLISYTPNKGKGYALKKGFAYIHETIKDNYVVVTMDSDGQHIITDAQKLLAYAQDNPNTYVLGMRKRNNKTPIRSKIGNTITMLFYKLATGIKIYDTQTGLRAFTNQLMNLMLSIPGNRFEYEMNCLLEVPKNDIPIHEIEINTIYYDNNKGSHFKIIRDSFLIYKDIFKFGVACVLSFIIDYGFFFFFTLIINNLSWCNILSRIISSSCNYLLNKKFVFQNKDNFLKSLIGYSILAIIILAFNTLFLNLLVYNLLINKFIAKIIVNVLSFVFSYFIQKRFVFNK